MPSADSTVPTGSRPTCVSDRVVGTKARMATKVRADKAAGA